MTRAITTALLAGALHLSAGADPALANGEEAPRPLRLFYRQPASEWTEALPIGNGRLAGMVLGGAPEERIALNEDTFWSGGPYDPPHAEAIRHLPEVRRLIRAGRYQPLGDLLLSFPGHDAPTEYERDLDLPRWPGCATGSAPPGPSALLPRRPLPLEVRRPGPRPDHERRQHARARVVNPRPEPALVSWTL
jgi:hypothetical protein